ncbi:MAG TPA: hypothetical protein VK694_03090 [Verrucomicrobiae bacterium]|nr:hypothetical protein [Verrucomicrobiae bacterium]
MSNIRHALDVVITPSGWRNMRKTAEVLIAPVMVMVIIWPFGLGTIKSPAGLVACTTAAAILAGGLTSLVTLAEGKHSLGDSLSHWRNSIWLSLFGLAFGIGITEMFIWSFQQDYHYVGIDTPDTTRIALTAVGFYVGFVLNTLFALRDGSFPGRVSAPSPAQQPRPLAPVTPLRLVPGDESTDASTN